jgi:Asp/Glu/hydantoin racemase
MKPTVAFIHTIAGLKDTFEELVREFLPDCSTCHIADETLIRRLLAAGGLTPEVYRRLSEHVVAAAEYGAHYIQFTCSSITPCAEWATKLVDVPVLSIDEPMVRGAVVAHERIGVIATNPATLKPSSDLVAAIATSVGRDVEVVPELYEGAYEALLSGDRPTHDRIVKERLGNLLTRVDAVCLAQASMSRVADMLEHEKPVYSSPRPAMEHLGEVIREASDAR